MDFLDVVVSILMPLDASTKNNHNYKHSNILFLFLWNSQESYHCIIFLSFYGGS